MLGNEIVFSCHLRDSVELSRISTYSKRIIICAYLLIYLQSHHHHPIQAYSLENYEVMFRPTRSDLFKVDLVNSPTVLTRSRLEPLWI